MSDRIVRACLVAILIFTPFALGANRLWAITPVFIVTLTGLCALVVRLNAQGASGFRRTPLGVPLFLFLALAGASCLSSAYPHDSIMALYRVITYIAIFYCIVNSFNTRESMLRLVSIIVGIGAVLSLLGIILYLGHRYYSYWLPGSTLSATYINRDHFAGYLEMVIPLAVGFLFTRPSKEKKVLAAFLVIMMLVAFVLAASRGAWVSLVAASFIAIPFLSGKRLLKRIALAAVLFGIILFFTLSQFDLTVAAARARTIIEGVGIDDTRAQMWLGTTDLITSKPWLGYGIGAFMHVFPQYRPVGIYRYWFIDHAHNDYLELTSELGIAGLFLILWVIASAVWTGLTGFRIGEGPFKRAISLGATIGVMSMALHSLVDFNLHIPANAIMFVTLIGIIMAMHGRRRYD